MNSTLRTFVVPRRPTLASGAYRTIEDSPAGEEERLIWLMGQEDRLRDEIKHGRECLDQARKRLAEQRTILEEWPRYEYRCGVDCLLELTETLQAQRRVERFLRGWLRRREEQMALVSRELERHAEQQTTARLNAEVERGAKEASNALPFLTGVKPEQAAARCSKSLAA
jgi:hypothetical protein